MTNINKLSIKEKIGYALGDGAANIAWRGVATFLFVFYTDVFGLNPATVLLNPHFSEIFKRFNAELIEIKTDTKEEGSTNGNNTSVTSSTAATPSTTSSTTSST